MNQIKYQKGFKYQLFEDYTIKIEVIGHTVDEPFLKLTPIGVLTIKKGYAWDGPSGPTFDTKDFMRGSLVHDALYELMRKELIAADYRDYSDRLLKNICREDGMPEIRFGYVYKAVSAFAAAAADPENKRKVITAP